MQKGLHKGNLLINSGGMKHKEAIRYQHKITCGLLASSAELATASNPTYAKNTTVAPVNIDLKPFGAKGDQLETSTLKAPTMMTKRTITTCRKVGVSQTKMKENVKHLHLVYIFRP